ncbi:hypothetical protein FJZ53_01745 [Candidatus Woesearchaeota archaeon]|nr:hypothetical protein [Candidatus Woesearchaeota archaeon]
MKKNQGAVMIIKKEELEKAVDAFVKELKVMLRAFEKEEEAEAVEQIYTEKKDIMLQDTKEYLEEAEGIEVL